MNAHTNSNSSGHFEKLVERYYGSLYRFAFSLSRNETDAWDLTQQTFYRWAKKGHMLRDPSKIKSWLFTTLYREFLKSNRRNRKMTSVEEIPETESRQAVPADVARKTDAAALMNLLGEIDTTFRVPLSLFYLEGMTYKEIAGVLDIPAGTVMSRLSRGKDRLKRLMDRYPAEMTARQDGQDNDE